MSDAGSVYAHAISLAKGGGAPLDPITAAEKVRQKKGRVCQTRARLLIGS